MRIKISTTARDLHAAIDAAWHREHRDQEPTCPECSGTGSQLSEDGTSCFACTAADYQEGDL
jgi:DnaJ-class molecular chaperone